MELFNASEKELTSLVSVSIDDNNIFCELVSFKGYYVWQFSNIRTYHQLDLNRVRCFNNKGIVDEYRNPKSAYFTIKELNKKVFNK